MDIPSKEDIIRKAGDLKVLPFVARKVLDTIGNENFSINDLSNIIEKDQAIAARILKISNSAFYGLRHEVIGINQAILILGVKTIRSLALYFLFQQDQFTKSSVLRSKQYGTILSGLLFQLRYSLQGLGQN